MTVTLHPSSSRSFSPLSTLPLASPHHLHPGSCNPAMDLVVLLAPVGQSSHNGGQVDRKGKSKSVDTSSWKGTKLVLWRMLGSKVWEVEMKGWVGGLAWSRDGLFLSVLAINSPTRSISVEHRSVHTGEIIKVVPLDLPEDTLDADMSGGSFGLEWDESGLKWEDPKDGSARMIIASIPTVTPVELPKPAVINPFSKPPPASSSKLPHSILNTFPTLLSSFTTPADILYITLQDRKIPLLTGSFAFRGALRPAHLRLAQSADLLGSFFNTTLRGLEAIEAAWREGCKQTMIWREELEECGKLQGMSVQDVHADLFRFLMTGRSREAISEWMGNKLTGRTLAKWEETLVSNLDKIKKVLCESVIPALERAVIVLEELRGWQRSEYHSDGLKLQSGAIERSLKIACGLLKLFDRIRLDAGHECSAAKAWFVWLKYETAKAGSGGGDEPHIATHDLKLTWSFLINGFVRSIFSTYFPDTPSRPPTETLPTTIIQNLQRKPPARDLDTILSETLSALSGRPPKLGPVSPSSNMSPDKSSMIMSSPIPSRELEPSGIEMSLEMDESGVIGSDDESDAGTTGKAKETQKEERGDGRVLGLEPWVWVNTLVQTVQGLIGDAVKTTDGHGYPRQGPDKMETSWKDEQQEWGASVNEDGTSVLLRCFSSTPTIVNIPLSPAICLAIQFFDNTELALILSTESGRYLVTTPYKDDLTDMELLSDTSFSAESIPSIPLVIHRSRYLGPVPARDTEDIISIALNGRKGRRVGCVMLGKEEVGVWDMEVNEDEEEEEEEGEEGEDMEKSKNDM